MRTGKRLNIASLNAHLICVICSGYYVEATTIVECLHTFCRSCIINYLKTNKFCPICDVQIHHSKPWSSLRSDKTMQDLVYKLVPGLYQDEMRRRREFYSGMVEEAPGAGDGEERGFLPHGARFFAQDDNISLSLEYYSGEPESGDEANGKPKRYLQCPAAVTVRHLKKFLQMKYGIGADSWVDIIYNDECLPEYFSLIDVAYTFAWRRTSPMRLLYRIFTKKVVKNVRTENKYKTGSPVKDVRKSAAKNTSSLEQQRKSEYLGNFNLNPTRSGFCRSESTNTGLADNRLYNEFRKKSCKEELQTDEGSRDKILIVSSEDSEASGLRIISEKEESTKENSEESRESMDKVKLSECGASAIHAFGEEAEDGFSKKLTKAKHKSDCKKERKKHDALHCEKRRKSASQVNGADESPKKNFLDGKKRRKSTMDNASDGDRLSRFGLPNNSRAEEEEPLANLKNEALRKVFVLKEKPEIAPKGKEDEVRRKKRKKSKHHEGEAKKRKTEIIPSPSILSFAKDPLKLKVKLTPMIIKPNDDVVEVDKSSEREGDEWECAQNYSIKRKLDDGNKKTMSDKERLLHLRAVRHKNIIKTNAQNYISAPRSLTISKVDASEQQATKPRVLESRPSLEIVLIPPSDQSKSKTGSEEKKSDLSKEVMDTFGVLDLSEKSTRMKEISLTSLDSTERSKKSTQQSIMQIAQTLVNRKMSPVLPEKRFDSVSDPTTAAAAMRNLKTLSDTAVNILMAAQSKGFPASPDSPKRTYAAVSSSPPQKGFTNPTKDCENSSGLKIPMFPVTRERANPIPPVPNLHEIYPKGRGRPLSSLGHIAGTAIKPGQNQTVRQIPNPSALLNRQNNQLLNQICVSQHKHRENGDLSPNPATNRLGSIPPLQSIKSKMILTNENLDKVTVPKVTNNNSNSNGGSSNNNNSNNNNNNNTNNNNVKAVQNGSDNCLISSAIKNREDPKRTTATTKVVSSTVNSIRRIESVAAGLTARAVSNAMVDAK